VNSKFIERVLRFYRDHLHELPAEARVLRDKIGELGDVSAQKALRFLAYAKQ
jgi:hypothetical protein